MMPRRLSVVTLGARHIPILRRFYQGLGWEPIPNSDDEFTAFLLGGVLLALYSIEALAGEAAPGAPRVADGAWNGVTLAANVDTREAVDEAFAAAVAAGATPVAEPVDRDWGGRSAYIADPEGNRWEIAWAPSARFDDDGALKRFSV